LASRIEAARASPALPRSDRLGPLTLAGRAPWDRGPGR
jgi:hypothetical protein